MRTTTYKCDVSGCDRTVRTDEFSIAKNWFTGHLTLIGGDGWANFEFCPDHFASLRDQPQLLGTEVLRLMDEYAECVRRTHSSQERG